MYYVLSLLLAYQPGLQCRSSGGRLCRVYIARAITQTVTAVMPMSSHADREARNEDRQCGLAQDSRRAKILHIESVSSFSHGLCVCEYKKSPVIYLHQTRCDVDICTCTVRGKCLLVRGAVTPGFRRLGSLQSAVHYCICKLGCQIDDAICMEVQGSRSIVHRTWGTMVTEGQTSIYIGSNLALSLLYCNLRTDLDHLFATSCPDMPYYIDPGEIPPPIGQSMGAALTFSCHADRWTKHICG